MKQFFLTFKGRPKSTLRRLPFRWHKWSLSSQSVRAMCKCVPSLWNRSSILNDDLPRLSLRSLLRIEIEAKKWNAYLIRMAGKGGGSKEGRAASRCKVLAWQAPCQSNSNPPVQPVRVQVDNISGQTNTFPSISISNCAPRVGIQGLGDECIDILQISQQIR